MPRTLNPLPVTGQMARLARLACIAAALAVVGGAHAQQGAATKPAPGAFERAKEGAAAAPVLSSPLPAGAGTVVPSGAGAGYHSPNSPIAPLPQRNDVVPCRC